MAQIVLDPNSNGHHAAWTGTFADVDDGATANDADFCNSGTTNNQRETFHVPNVTTGQIPDGATINSVEIQARVGRGGSQNVNVSLTVADGSTNSDAAAGAATATITEFARTMTTDPITGAAWALGTLRNWQSGGSVPRSFGIINTQARDARLYRLRILVDYTPAATTAHEDHRSRFALLAQAYRDAQSRFALLAGALRDHAARFGLSASAYRDAQARFGLDAAAVRRAVVTWIELEVPFAARAWTDARARFRLLAVSYRDARARFALLGVGSRDHAARFAGLALAHRDRQARFRALALAHADHGARFLLRSLTGAYRDAQARFRSLAVAHRDTAGRFRLLAIAHADHQARLRTLVRGFTDARSRLGTLAGTYRDVRARFAALALAYDDAQARFRAAALAHRDHAARFRQVATGYRDIAARFIVRTISAAYRDAQGRFGLSSPRIARPDEDIAVGAWTDQLGGTTAIYQSIDEAGPDDADYVQSPPSPVASAYTFGLPDLPDPGVSASHVVRYRYGKDAAGGEAIDLTVELLQGATVIATWNHLAVSDVVAEAEQVLSAAQADSLVPSGGAYTDLRMRVTAGVS